MSYEKGVRARAAPRAGDAMSVLWFAPPDAIAPPSDPTLAEGRVFEPVSRAGEPPLATSEKR